ncbi:hypothetical protein Goshw_009452 [Gossypium schwendimanii]|uniref:RNase H type-1 domain-containing protein n=1 Tax=Gossypium schwendimanii TaxID=34291 RepID=A0A7J9KWP4_GOSSC|nr:hypothetical protein [Gossypium schwendimanii]
MVFGPHRFFWKALWKLDTIPKGCPKYGAGNETLIHALKDYPTSRAILSIGGWNNNRNKYIFKGKEEEAQVIWERASTLSKDFRICNMMKESLLSPNLAIKKWVKPPQGFVKINFGTTVGVNRIGYGTTAEGFVLRGGGSFIEMMMSAEEAECYAFKASIKLACQLNIKGDVLFETDNAGLVNKLRNHSTNVTIISARIKACKEAFNNFKSADLN